MLKRLVQLSFTVVLLSGLWSCNPFKGQLGTSGKSKGSTLVAGFPEQELNIYDNSKTSQLKNLIKRQILEGLTAPSLDFDEGYLVPQLARSWDVSGDGLVYTFHLRQDISWTDGKRLNVDNFIRTIKSVLDSGNSTLAEPLFAIKGARAYFKKEGGFNSVGVEAIDPYTLKIELAQPLAFFPLIFSSPEFFPTPPSLTDDSGDPVCLGPYKLIKGENAKNFSLVINKEYYGKKPRVQKIDIQLGVDSKQAMKLLKRGSLDLYGQASSDQDWKSIGTVSRVLSGTIAYLSFDVSTKPIQNPIFRRSFALGIDRNELVRLAGEGNGPELGFIPRGVFSYESNRGTRFDPLAAKTLFNNSGYRQIEKFKDQIVLVSKDSRIPPSLLTSIKDQVERHTGLVIKTNEVDSKLAVIEVNTYRAIVSDPHFYMSPWTTQAKSGLTKWKNREFDEYVRQASYQTSPVARSRLYAKAQHVLVEEDIPIMPLYSMDEIWVAGPRLISFSPSNAGHIQFSKISLQP
ncbi:MAG: hypothetical protein IT289_04990 [Oligoflexia bacterium]|nr:hypothetical protein [Oligoflexia bacterium]